MPVRDTSQASILIVDDDPITRELLEARLEDAGFRVFLAEGLSEFKCRIKERSFDLVLLDLFLGEENGLEVIPDLMRESPYSKIVVMSAHGTIQLAVDALEKGATTFLCKTQELGDLVSVLSQKFPPKPKLARLSPLSGKNLGIVGATPNIQDVITKIELFKDVDSTILITGESGTGKELVARAIHGESLRRDLRFEAINCGAIPENLLESELFGHKRGAFTDAKSDRKGLFEICDGGTLLLDEIGEMPLPLQVKILRVLQEKEVTPIGGSQSLKIDTRVVVATNRDLAEEVKRGTFRNDLYYRLNVLRIHVPPLRDRKADIPLLIDGFLERFNRRFSRSVKRCSKELETRLVNYDWPGNIRELQNAVERATVLSPDGELHLEHMLELSTEGCELTPADAPLTSDLWQRSLSDAKCEFEKAYLQHLLQATKGNISEVARISGRYRTDIYRLMTKYNMEGESFRS